MRIRRIEVHGILVPLGCIKPVRAGRRAPEAECIDGRHCDFIPDYQALFLSERWTGDNGEMLAAPGAFAKVERYLDSQRKKTRYQPRPQTVDPELALSAPSGYFDFNTYLPLYINKSNVCRYVCLSIATLW